MDRGPGLDAWIRLATWRRSTHCVISGGMLAALPCKLWPSPTGVGNTWTWVSSTPYPRSPSSCSLPYWTHTRADPRSPSSRPRCTHPEETCAKEAEKPGSGWWRSYNFGEMRHPPMMAKYTGDMNVLNTVNPDLDPGSKITWDDVVTQTPWMARRLHDMMAAQEMTIKHQALPVPGESSELEVVLEKRYSEQLIHSKRKGEARS